MNAIKFAWKMSNDATWQEETFPIHPMIRAESNDIWMDAFKKGFDQYVDRTTPIMKGNLDAWRKHDSSLKAQAVIGHTDPDLAKLLIEYQNERNIEL
jgi:hypothetical protein